VRGRQATVKDGLRPLLNTAHIGFASAGLRRAARGWIDIAFPVIARPPGRLIGRRRCSTPSAVPESNLCHGCMKWAPSHGQRVKASLLLVFARRPKLLVLDEPTTGLDPVARHEILRELSDVMADEDRSVLFSSQNTQDVEQISDCIRSSIGAGSSIRWIRRGI
jgi:ABC-type uncharacterized transport system YnjBCD ATPase subunit